jgi:two-component system nitrate/nitrite response regulator NarL
MEKRIRVGIFDDHAFFIKGLTGFLDTYKDIILVAFTANTREELHKKLDTQTFDVLIMDVLAPDVTGLELYVEVLKKQESARIVSYTSLRSEILIETLLSLGVKGYVNKNQAPEDLIEAIRDVFFGLTYVPEAYRSLIPEEDRKVKDIFTNREFQILQLIAKGATSEQIANELQVSLRTIENLKVTLFKKMEVKNAAELIIAAGRLGYVS